MKAVKYYYSEALQLRTLRVLTDAKGDVKIILPSVPEHIKDLPRVTVCSLYDSVENKVRQSSSKIKECPENHLDFQGVTKIVR